MMDEARTVLTDADVRVLQFCARYPRWHPLLMLESILLLRPDDHLAVPSLVMNGFLESVGIAADCVCVRITERGRFALADLR